MYAQQPYYGYGRDPHSCLSLGSRDGCRDGCLLVVWLNLFIVYASLVFLSLFVFFFFGRHPAPAPAGGYAQAGPYGQPPSQPTYAVYAPQPGVPSAPYGVGYSGAAADPGYMPQVQQQQQRQW